jgi:hypothetical protein
MMFCISCRRQYKSKMAYKAHVQTPSHRKAEDEFKRNRREHLAQARMEFVEGFVSFVSQLEEYVEIGDAYRRYLSRGVPRMDEVGFRSMQEVANSLQERISQKSEDGRILVRKLSSSWREEKALEFDFSQLRSSFKLRVVERGQSSPGQIFGDPGSL